MPMVNVRKQSLRWLFAELLVIVLGISIAFQVEEWRNELSERRTEREVLLSMLDDYEIAKEQFQIYLEIVNRQATATQEYRD